MDVQQVAEQIVHKLATFWSLHKSPDFLSYLANTFGNAPSKAPEFECIYIFQAKTGDAGQGVIGGLLEQWWIIDDDGIRKIANPDLPLQPDERENVRSGFYPRPVLTFFFSGTQITTGESFGPTYVCRKIARLEIGSEGGIELRGCNTVWTWASLSRELTPASTSLTSRIRAWLGWWM